MIYKVFVRTIMLCLITVAISCKKDEQSNNTQPPISATISGSITPVRGVLSISLEMENGIIKETIVPSSDGKFTFSPVEAGKYKIKVANTSLYKATSPLMIEANSPTVTLPPITLTYEPAGQTGIVNFTVDNVPYSIFYDAITLNYTTTAFNLNGSTPTNPSYYSFDLKLNGTVNAGTYNLLNSPSYLSISYYTSPSNSAGNWSTNNGGTATVTITSLNTTTRTASGSFTGSLVPQGSSSGTKQISGTFTNVVY